MSAPPRRILSTIHRLLENAYGFQGWWPLSSRASRAGYDAEGYRTVRRPVPAPLGEDERLEIALGAILTQNTAWENARRAMASLKAGGLVSVEGLRAAGEGELAAAIRASGYFNQKAKKVRLLAEYLAGRAGDNPAGTPPRGELLALWGIGPETADSILLYGYSEPYFVADAYARRIFGRVGAAESTASYERVQELCHASLPRDSALYGEYHALLVRHGRTHCRKSPRCAGCPLREICDYGKVN